MRVYILFASSNVFSTLTALRSSGEIVCLVLISFSKLSDKAIDSATASSKLSDIFTVYAKDLTLSPALKICWAVVNGIKTRLSSRFPPGSA